jgi:hypothetical protein
MTTTPCQMCGKLLDVKQSHNPPTKCKPCKIKAQYQRRSSVKDFTKIRKAYVLQWRYGITLEEYEKLLEKQGGGCALCGKAKKKKPLHVDHCHKTGKVRGLLCPPCNRAVGVLGDSKEALEKVVAYLA